MFQNICVITLNNMWLFDSSFGLVCLTILYEVLYKFAVTNNYSYFIDVNSSGNKIHCNHILGITHFEKSALASANLIRQPPENSLQR